MMGNNDHTHNDNRGRNHSSGENNKGDSHGHNHGSAKGHSHGNSKSHSHGNSKGDSASHNHNHSHNHSHSHGHSHSHHGHSHAQDFVRDGNKKGLIIALSITAVIMVLEFVGGLWTNSLALLSDSGHMLSDASSLLLSLLAMIAAAKAATPRKSYGNHRFEILAALFNAVTLFAIAGFIIYEAVHRFMEPPVVSSGSMMAIAAVGLLANLASAWQLMRKGDVEHNINMRSAYLHVLGDALGSVGAIAAGLVMMLTGWYAADPIISVIVALLILKGAWGVLSSSVHVLMEGTPANVDHDQVKQSLMQLPGVRDVHDLHIWTITSGLVAMTCHLLVDDEADSQEVLHQALHLLEDDYGIGHATVQVETSRIHHSKLCSI
ncbi:cation diffusion facilitator family transporter [Paenibacillus sp. MBLB4367]|uniref:cation diffusion facilitator family transporter n=1 Tax=Paenibacillus sp. MBLB4367 TaxID=3384767 RepID=UPI0039081988